MKTKIDLGFLLYSIGRWIVSTTTSHKFVMDEDWDAILGPRAESCTVAVGSCPPRQTDPPCAGATGCLDPPAVTDPMS